MIFTLIESIHKLYPKSDIVLLDEDLYNDQTRKFNFRILPDIPMNSKLKITNKFLYILYKLSRRNNRFGEQLNKKIFESIIAGCLKHAGGRCTYSIMFIMMMIQSVSPFTVVLLTILM